MRLAPIFCHISAPRCVGRATQKFRRIHTKSCPLNQLEYNKSFNNVNHSHIHFWFLRYHYLIMFKGSTLQLGTDMIVRTPNDDDRSSVYCMLTSYTVGTSRRHTHTLLCCFGLQQEPTALFPIVLLHFVVVDSPLTVHHARTYGRSFSQTVARIRCVG